MAWHNIVSSTTVDSSDMNDNFLYVGQGSRFPMTSFGADMGYTTGVYDLGSSAYRWSNVYANSISVSGSISASKLMTLEADIIVSVATAKVEILGLNGDNATNFLVVVSSTDKGPLMCINQDSASANYGFQYLRGQSTAATAGRGNTPGMELGGANGLGVMELYTKTGNERVSVTKMMERFGQASTINSIYLRGQTWNNTTSTITSLQFVELTIGANSRIMIFGRN